MNPNHTSNCKINTGAADVNWACTCSLNPPLGYSGISAAAQGEPGIVVGRSVANAASDALSQATIAASREIADLELRMADMCRELGQMQHTLDHLRHVRDQHIGHIDQLKGKLT